MALESDPFFQGCDNCYDANIPIWENGQIVYHTHNNAFVYGTPDAESVSDYNWGVYQEGTGITKDGRYISIDPDHETEDNRTVFIYQEGGSCRIHQNAWGTVATGDPRLECGDKVTIDAYPGMIFTVTDTGSEVSVEHLDVFVGPMNVADFKARFASPGSTFFYTKVTRIG